MIDKGIVEACMKDIEHTFCCYEYLQRELHISSGSSISRFTELLSTPARRLVSDEDLPFARNFSQVVIRVINSIAESSLMVLPVSKIKEMVIRPSTQFFQTVGNIEKSVREIRMKQAGFVSACIMAM